MTKSQFLVAANQIASELGILATNVEHNISEYENHEFSCDASGQTQSGFPRFELSVWYSMRPTLTHKPGLQASIEIQHEEHTRFEQDDDITPHLGAPNFLIRWAGWAMHKFNLEYNPINLETYLGPQIIHIYGYSGSDVAVAEFQLLMKGLQVANTNVTVLKFRHVDPNLDWYRSYSYGVWAKAESDGNGLWIFFCDPAGLDSGGSYGDYRIIEQSIHDLGKNVTIKNFDIKKEDLERFVFQRNQKYSELHSLYESDAKSLFESLDFHPIVKEAASKLFENGHYPECVFAAFRDLVAYVKTKSGRSDLDGVSLMGTVFSKDSPILALNELRSTSDKDEQDGFKFLYMGATAAFRNPPAHEKIQLTDPKKALEYLTLASLLARRVDEARKVEGKDLTKESPTIPSQPAVSGSNRKESTSLSRDQLAYRALLREELITLRILLDNVTNPIEVPYSVWLSNHDIVVRRKLIGNDDEHDLIQGFYTDLQNRYDYQKTMQTPDAEFAKLNTDCIRAYDKVVTRVKFVADNEQAKEKLQTYAQLSEIVSRIIGGRRIVSRAIGSPIQPGDSIPIPSTDFEKIRGILEDKKSLIADSTSEAWGKARTTIIAHTQEHVLDLPLLFEFQKNVKYHLEFLQKQLPSLL